ncbi:MAG: DUF1972 domain-containing protein [Muribaculaceae bacterium]|nr:DUF1972 domain-containing protein [Muribaculaceae bacterium]
MTKVAVIGTQGVPAKYGGFESLVENLLGDNCPEDVEYTVFCSGKDMPERLDRYKGARLEYVPLKANGIQSVPYDIVSMCKALRGFDVILVLGVSGCLFLPIFHKLNSKKLIINIDGMEYKRNKWNKFVKRILKKSEAMAVKYADVIITDNKAIRDYVAMEYGKKSKLIAYGGDHVMRTLPEGFAESVLDKYRLNKGEYAIAVCRIEPENNCDIVLEAFSKSDKKLIYIGNWDHNLYSQELRNKYSAYPNIQMLDAIYDLDILYALRSNAGIYVHGHSAGGTNPSLVEAMFFGMPIISFDVIFNRATTADQAYYFHDANELLELIDRKDLDGTPMKKIARERYTWKSISKQYAALYR